MNKDFYDRLLELSTEDLARALCELAERDNAVKAHVERMVQTPKEAARRFRARIAALKRSTRFVHRGGAPEVARSLADDLRGLRESGIDPRTGVELLVAFYGAAGSLFERCDDSYGTIGDIFRHDAAELFVDFAARCDDAPWLRDIALRSVLEPDDYGVSDIIASRAAEYLPPEAVRDLVEELVSPGRSDERRWVARAVAAGLAAAIREPDLFERIRTMEGRAMVPTEIATLARIHLERGDATAARRWIEQMPAQTAVMGLDELRLSIYERLGDRASMEETAWEAFRMHRSLERFKTLLSIVGHDRRDQIVRDQVAAIAAEKGISYASLVFLIDVGETAAAGECVLARAGGIDGDLYTTLLPLARRLADEQPLAATILYRALVDSILRRARSAIYPHAVGYLAALEKLAPAIREWHGVPGHADYLRNLAAAHARKTSFWKLVGG